MEGTQERKKEEREKNVDSIFVFCRVNRRSMWKRIMRRMEDVYLEEKEEGIKEERKSEMEEGRKNLFKSEIQGKELSDKKWKYSNDERERIKEGMKRLKFLLFTE